MSGRWVLAAVQDLASFDDEEAAIAEMMLYEPNATVTYVVVDNGEQNVGSKSAGAGDRPRPSGNRKDNNTDRGRGKGAGPRRTS